MVFKRRRKNNVFKRVSPKTKITKFGNWSRKLEEKKLHFNDFSAKIECFRQMASKLMQY